jgi:hypothetical protein
MSDLMLYIPTYRRVERQLTLNCLSKDWKNRTVLVCPPDEAKALGKLYPDVYSIKTPSTDKVPNIAAKRSWIFQTTHYEKIMVFDDDLTIFVRQRGLSQYAGYQKGDPKKWPDVMRNDKALIRLVHPNPMQQDSLFYEMDRMLNSYVHGGISPRFMNYNIGHEWVMNRKATHALAYFVPTVLDVCKLGRVRMFEDLDYTLQLLRHGHENAIYCWGAVNANGFNAPGGESENRTSKDIAYGADLMAKLHPGIVHVVERHGPDAERLGPKRIVVGWQKAIKEGLRQ